MASSARKYSASSDELNMEELAEEKKETKLYSNMMPLRDFLQMGPLDKYERYSKIFFFLFLYRSFSLEIYDIPAPFDFSNSLGSFFDKLLR